MYNLHFKSTIRDSSKLNDQGSEFLCAFPDISKKTSMSKLQFLMPNDKQDDGKNATGMESIGGA